MIHLKGSLLYGLILLAALAASAQDVHRFRDYTELKKRVFTFTKVEFITEDGEFNDAIGTLVISDFQADSPPYVAIYYRRTDSEWFTESLYRKRVRFSFMDGVIKLDSSNFWDWIELEEIRVIVIY